MKIYRLNKLRSSLLLTVAVFVTSSVWAQEVTDELLAEFEQEFQTQMQTYNVPGSAVAIVQNGEIVYAKGFGVRNLETGEPVTTSTVFRVGSTTKAMTSMMIATLVDEGVLAWDTPVIDIYPDFKLPTEELTQSVTVRELMGMGTGLGSNIPSPYWDEYSATDLLGALATFPVLGKKGETYFYNNEVYSSAGYIAALATNPGEQDLLEVYKALMQERVFDPLGMDTAVLSDDPASVSDDYAASYSFSLAGGTEATELVPYATINTVAPAGAVVTNVMDMARFVITQLNEGINPEGEQIVSAENLKETWKGQTKTTGEVLPGASQDMVYAMGWLNERYDNVEIIWHNGGWDGFISEMAMLPEAETGIVILSNSSFGGVFNLVMRYKFIELLYGMEPNLSKQVAALLQQQIDELSKNAAMFPSRQVEASSVQAYLGNYEHGWQLEHRDDGTLWLLRPGWELQLLPTPEGFVVSSGVVMGAQISFSQGDKPSMLFNFQGATIAVPRQ
jgi:CubicO group peptidase (beta-lactamase class C family)